MIEFLSALFWFIVTISVLVTLHEFGHFWAARKLGITVMRFAIGFGPALYKRKLNDDLEFAINAIPLGGYVKFLDTRLYENADGTALNEQANDWQGAFNLAPIWKRAVVAIAGPLANLVLAFFAFSAIYWIGVTDERAVLGDVKGLAENAGLRYGEEIIAIEQTPVGDWTRALVELANAGYAGKPIQMTVRPSENQHAPSREVTLDLSQLPPRFDEKLLESLGIAPMLRHPVLAPQPDSAAQRAGLLSGDRVLAVSGQVVNSRGEMIEAVQKAAEKSQGRLELLILRNSLKSTVLVTAKQEPGEGGQSVWRIGTGFASYSVVRREGFLAGLRSGLYETQYFFTRSLTQIKSLLTGLASPKNVSGPLTIAQAAAGSAERGPGEFMRFIALVSLSLFIVNMLPIPVLDGGHLLMLAIEKIKGSALSERAQEYGAMVGLAAIASLMILAFSNDFSRIFGN